MASGSIFPQKGDKLFAEGAGGKDFHLKSILWSFGPHARAFRDAADMLLKAYVEDSRSGHRDELILPVAYLYRHALELQLKHLIRLGVVAGVYTRDTVKDMLRKEHSLTKLWNKTKLVIEDAWPKDPEGFASATESLINEMNTIDPTGQAWRYETDTSGKRHDYDKLPEWVSLFDLQINANRVFDFLEGCADGIDEGISAMRESM